MWRRSEGVEALISRKAAGGRRSGGRIGATAAVIVLAAAGATSAAPGGGDPRGAAAVGGLLFLVSVLTVPSSLAFGLLVSALAPSSVARAQEQLVGRRLACLLAGFGTALAAWVAVTVLGKVPGIGPLLAAVILAGLILGVLIGLPAIGTLVGRSLLEMSGRPASPLAAAGSGLLVILLASALPVLGWVLFVFLCLTGLGAAILRAPGGHKPLENETPAEEALPGTRPFNLAELRPERTEPAGRQSPFTIASADEPPTAGEKPVI